MSNSTGVNYRFLLPLSLTYFALLIMIYLVAYKIVQLGPWVDTAAIFVIPLAFTPSDVVAEIYGYRVVRQLIVSTLIISGFFCLGLILFIDLPSPSSWHKKLAYQIAFSPVLRVYFAVSLSLTASMLLNTFCLTRWKRLLAGRLFWLRSLGSSGIGESVFGIMAATIAFFGQSPQEHLVNIIVTGITLKLLYNMITIGPAALLTALLKQLEVAVVNQSMAYNPIHEEEGRQGVWAIFPLLRN